MQQQGQGLPPIPYQVPMPQPPQKSGGFGGGGMGGFVVALLVALAVSYGMLQFMGVPKSELTAFQSTIQNTVNTFSGRLSAVESRSVPPDLSVRMADVEAKVRTVTTVDTSGLVKTDLSNVTAAVLEAKLTELGYKKAGTITTTPSGTTGEYGELVDTDGDLELWLERVNPSSDPMRFGGNEATFELVVVNKSDSSEYYNLMLRFTPEATVQITLGTSTVNCYPSGLSLWTITRASDTVSTTNPVYVGNSSKVWAGKNDTTNLMLAVKLTEGAYQYWDYKMTIEQID